MVCPQCGGNDLIPLGNSAYKCQACGTILKDELEEKVVEPNAISENQITPATPVNFMTSEERYGSSYDGGNAGDSDSFIKSLVIISVIAIVVIVLVYFLAGK